MNAPPDLLELLIQQGHLTEDDAEKARRRQKRSNCNIEDALIDLKTVEQEIIFQAVAAVNDLEYVNLTDMALDKKFIHSVPRKVILHYNFVPIEQNKGILKAAFSVPPSLKDKQQLRTLLRIQRLDPVITTPLQIARANQSLFGLGMETVVKINKNRDIQDVRVTQTKAQDLETAADDTVGKLFNQFLIEALKLRATDIHIEPFQDDVHIRFRVDGMLREVNAPQGLRDLHAALVSHVKVRANLNIAEMRLPHDGRMRVGLKGTEFDLRVSIMPTRFGETLNMRILNTDSVFYSLSQLGLSDHYHKILSRLLELPHGMILVTGPTGSGKSTTLYASLDKTDHLQRKVITIEDPVEYQMEGISQIQINAPIGLTFARGLRSILRHDPDIVLVGEIRDHETAEIAIRAALTGHLVLSTLHTNDAVGAVNRLTDIGIDPYLVAASLSASIAQRLIRRICKYCKEEVPADDIPKTLRKEIAKSQNVDEADVKAFHGKGCLECGESGYSGRVAIYEFFLMDQNLMDIITRGATTVEIRDMAIEKGMSMLRDDGWRKVLSGLSTIDEVLRITTSYDIGYQM